MGIPLNDPIIFTLKFMLIYDMQDRQFLNGTQLPTNSQTFLLSLIVIARMFKHIAASVKKQKQKNMCRFSH
jgi:hypothetical protein